MKLNFKQFFESTTNPNISDYDIFVQYNHFKTPVKDISNKTGKSIGEIYRIIKKMGGNPNRRKKNQHLVKSLLQSDFSSKKIGNLTGYTRRQVDNIRKKHDSSR